MLGPLPDGKRTAANDDEEEPLRYPEPLKRLYGSGHVGSLTFEQAHALEQMHLQLERSGFDLEYAASRDATVEVYLLRFLRTKRFRIDGAIALARDDFAWRERMNVNGIREMTAAEAIGCDPELALSFFPHFWHGSDRYGRPVLYSLYGKFELKRLLGVTSWEAITRHHVWESEQVADELIRATSQRGHIVDKVLVVIDLEGFHLSMLSSHLLHFLSTIGLLDQKHYAERLGLMVIINAPSFFSSVQARITKLLDPEGLVQVKVFGGRAEWGPFLEELVGKQQLPEDFGGRALPFGSLVLGGFVDGVSDSTGTERPLVMRVTPTQHSQGPSVRYGPSVPIVDVDAADARAAERFRRVRATFDRSNAAFASVMMGLVLLAVYATVDLAWMAAVLSLWAPVTMLGFGGFALMLSLLGFVSGRRRSLALAQSYMLLQGLLGAVFLCFAVGSFWLAGVASEVVGTVYESVRPVFPSGIASREALQEHLQVYSVAWGVATMLSAIMCIALTTVANRFRTALAAERALRTRQEREGKVTLWRVQGIQDVQLSARLCAVITLLDGTACMSLGVWLLFRRMQFEHETNYFTPYLLSVYGLTLMIVGAGGWSVAYSQSRSGHRTLIMILAPLACSLLVASAVAFNEVNVVEANVADRFERISAIAQLVVIGIVEAVTSALLLTHVVLEVVLLREVERVKRGRLGVDPSIYTSLRHRTPIPTPERAFMLSALAIGWTKLVFSGQYLIFATSANSLHTLSEDRNSVLWHLYARGQNADKLSLTQTRLLIIVELLSLFSFGVGNLAWAWGIFQQTAWRHAVAIAVCATAIFASLLLLLSDASTGFNFSEALVTDLLAFWVLFFVENALPLLLAGPALYYYVPHTARAIELLTSIEGKDPKLVDRIIRTGAWQGLQFDDDDNETVATSTNGSPVRSMRVLTRTATGNSYSGSPQKRPRTTGMAVAPSVAPTNTSYFGIEVPELPAWAKAAVASSTAGPSTWLSRPTAGARPVSPVMHPPATHAALGPRPSSGLSNGRSRV